jgi:hypothetical protein
MNGIALDPIRRHDYASRMRRRLASVKNYLLAEMPGFAVAERRSFAGAHDRSRSPVSRRAAVSSDARYIVRHLWIIAVILPVCLGIVRILLR